MEEMFCSGIMKWIGDVDFKDSLDQAREICKEGTAEWLFEKPNYLAWRSMQSTHDQPLQSSSLPASLLWVSG